MVNIIQRFNKLYLRCSVIFTINNYFARVVSVINLNLDVFTILLEIELSRPTKNKKGRTD